MIIVLEFVGGGVSFISLSGLFMQLEKKNSKQAARVFLISVEDAKNDLKSAISGIL